VIDNCEGNNTFVGLQGDTSEWVHVTFPYQCFNQGISIILGSSPDAPFDMDVYEGPILHCFPFACDASSTCPPLIQSVVAVPSGGAPPIAWTV
jgi:hypothetical protein